MKNLLTKIAKKGLCVLEKNASKKANAECVGFMYEPKIPKKLKKMLCLGLACVLTTVTLLGGSAGKYYAANYVEWQTMKTSPISTLDTDITKLYYDEDKTYRWAVTSCQVPSGYGQVTLNGNNVTVQMKYNYNHALNAVGYKDYTVSNFSGDSNNYYAICTIIMGYDSYPTMFSGYAKILD